ncbi:MAG: metallophosphoesterase [Candidatus Bathyarchaeota archaeon]|nr:metallophosphoesterase [Candidatus Bathyarchaeota archaeon]
MLIGIISDTHDNLSAVEKAINYLNTQKTDLVLHAGDYVSPFVIPKFKQLNCKLIGVLGNNDGDHQLLKTRFDETPNCQLHGRFAQITTPKDFTIAMLHGDENELLNALISHTNFDAIIYGHHHKTVNATQGKTLIINPGELCGYLTGKQTLALLDTEKREAKIIEI